MLYYSMQVLWPRESSLLFVPADEPLIRGAYANLTVFATWRKLFTPVKPTDEFELICSSVFDICLDHLRKIRQREMADPSLHMLSIRLHWWSVDGRGGRQG